MQDWIIKQATVCNGAYLLRVSWFVVVVWEYTLLKYKVSRWVLQYYQSYILVSQTATVTKLHAAYSLINVCKIKLQTGQKRRRIGKPTHVLFNETTKRKWVK